MDARRIQSEISVHDLLREARTDLSRPGHQGRRQADRQRHGRSRLLAAIQEMEQPLHAQVASPPVCSQAGGEQPSQAECVIDRHRVLETVRQKHADVGRRQRRIRRQPFLNHPGSNLRLLQKIAHCEPLQ